MARAVASRFLRAVRAHTPAAGAPPLPLRALVVPARGITHGALFTPAAPGLWQNRVAFFPRAGPATTRSIFIQTEETPNPSSLKFLPGQEVLPPAHGSGMFFQRGDREYQRSPLCVRLFRIEGITGVFLGRDFITITKASDEGWDMLRPQVFSVLMDAAAEGVEVITEAPVVSDTTILDEDDEVVAMIKELLETRVRPAVQEDGGDIFYVSFDEGSGIVKLRLAGSCQGCPSSSVTLKHGVENMLMHYIPEVKGVEQADEDELAAEEAQREFEQSLRD